MHVNNRLHDYFGYISTDTPNGIEYILGTLLRRRYLYECKGFQSTEKDLDFCTGPWEQVP
jgi:hypothetical protein